MGIDLLQAASKTNDTAGDGTTTATILSAAIIAEGMKIVAAGTNPIQVCATFDMSLARLQLGLLEHSPCGTSKLIGLAISASAGSGHCYALSLNDKWE